MLSDITVLELGCRVSTGYLGKLLHDLGATVVKVEPAAGDALRHRDPDYAAYLHAGKRSVTIRPDDASEIDVVICDDSSVDVGELMELRVKNPELIITSISDYGLDGPRAGTPATEFTLQSESGLTALHPTGDRPPVPAGVDLVELSSAASAAHGVLTALVSGGGIDVDVSRYEAALSMLQYPWLGAQIEGHSPYPLPQNAIPGIELASDGWVCVVSVTDPQWQDFKRMAGVSELDDPRYDSFNDRVLLAAEVTPLVRRFTTQHTVAELVELGARHRVPTTPVGTPETLAGLAPYATRNTYVRNESGGFTQPRSPFRYAGAQTWSPASLAPVGQHDGQSISPKGRARVSVAEPQFPLRGLRILELGTFQAGPLVTRNLAMLGADVVKVEAVQRPDLIRFAGSPMTVARSWERGAPFVGTNQGKRLVTADLNEPAGLEIVRRLIARSDLVLDNYVPQVLAKRGLDYEGMRAIQPSIIMIRLPAWGLTGPWRDRPGFTYSVDATSGLSDLTGYPDGDPMMTGTVVDPIAAEYSTFVALAAIRRKQLTGEGGEIEVPLCDIAAQLTAKAVVHASAGVEMPTRQGCRHPHFAPQGMYLAADLRWVAISVASDKQWAAFGTLPEAKSWAADERFAALAGRQAHHDELDERVRAMCSTVAADELVETLRALGVPAAPLGVGSDAIADRQLLARGRVFTLEHKVFGPISYLGPAMRYSHTPVAAMPWATPVFGEHNYEVLSELGYSRDEIQALLAAKSIGDSPFGLPFPR